MVSTISTIIDGLIALIAGLGLFFLGYFIVLTYSIYIEILGTAVFFVGLGLAAIGFVELGTYDSITLRGKNDQ